MSRSYIELGSGNKRQRYRLWLRVDTSAPKGFPKELLEQVVKLARDEKTRRHIKAVKKNMLVVDVPLFDAMQSDLDILPKCECALFAENVRTKKMRAVREGARMYGRKKDEYDEILRFIRF